MRVDPRLTPCWFRQLRHLIDRTGGADLAAEMLGQAPVEITKQHFVEPDEREFVTAEILEALAAAAEGAKPPKRNAMHYDSEVFECVDWSLRGAYMEQRHGITADVANDALGDANRVVIDPDYNSTTGRSVRIIGFSIIADDIITVIVLEDEGSEYGVNGWVANEKDRRLYNQGGQHEQED